MSEQWLDIGLGIDAAVAIDVAVEMNGETRNHRQRAAKIHQVRPQAATRTVAHHDPPGQGKVAVEPGIEQRAAIDLDAQLKISAPVFFGIGPHHQAGTVGVGAQHADAMAAERFRPHHKGDQRRIIADAVVAAAGLQIPVGGFRQRLEPRS